MYTKSQQIFVDYDLFLHSQHVLVIQVQSHVSISFWLISEYDHQGLQETLLKSTRIIYKTHQQD